MSLSQQEVLGMEGFPFRHFNLPKASYQTVWLCGFTRRLDEKALTPSPYPSLQPQAGEAFTPQGDSRQVPWHAPAGRTHLQYRAPSSPGPGPSENRKRWARTTCPRRPPSSKRVRWPPVRGGREQGEGARHRQAAGLRARAPGSAQAFSRSTSGASCPDGKRGSTLERRNDHAARTDPRRQTRH